MKVCQISESVLNDSDSCFIKSINHEMYLQEMRKSSLSPFDKKSWNRGNIESIPWK